MSDNLSCMRISTWNVNGLGNPIKRKKVMNSFKSNKYDVVFLQETHMSPQESDKLCVGWVGHVFYSAGSSKSKGVTILINRNLQFKCLKQIKDTLGRIVIVLAEIQGLKLILANIYAPNGDDRTFFTDLEGKLQAAGNYEVVLGGDFNLLMDPVLDHSGSAVCRTPRASLTLQRICKTWGLIDIWRMLNPAGRDYTFFSSMHKTFSRIDFFLVSKSIVSSVTGCSIGSIIISDHAWVCLNLIPQSERRRSYRWRLNSSILQEPATVDWLRSEIKNYLEINSTSVNSASVVWEALKAVIRGRIIQHTSHRKKANAQQLLDLESKIKDAETKLKQRITCDGLRELTRLKYQYNNILSQKVEFNLFRARQIYFESGDKAGKLLARYIKQRESASTIPAIRSQAGDIVTATVEINKIFKEFYINLYSSTSTSTDKDIESFVRPLGLPKLTEEQRQFLDSDITMEELRAVINDLPTGKAPGPDGYTAEFFKSFATELAPALLEMYKEALERGILPPTLRQALISLVPKKGKDPGDCKNYRPISLMQLDAKLISKILANRLNKVITSIIHTDQVGFICGRSSSDNIRRLINIMWSVAEVQSPVAAISLDAEKAFDMVEWGYLFKILEVYGFGDTFIKWIRLLYKHPEAAVQTNGFNSEYFALGRGTRQGSPLSPLLFCLAIEPLAAAIRAAPDFPGVLAGGVVHKLMLYADDILLVVSDPARSVPSLLNIIDTFSKFSGYRVNWSKSEALPLTAYCPSAAFRPGAFQWPKQGIRYLGILFPPQLKDLVKLNFDPLLHKISCDLDRWAVLKLSMVGKVNVIKMNCVPKLNYLIHSLPLEIPLSYFKWFDRITKIFIWNGKRPRLHINKLQRPMDKGGLGLPKMVFYYYAFNLRHLAHWTLPPERAPPWYSIEQSALAPISPLECLSIKLDRKVITHPIISHLKSMWIKVARLFNLDPYLNACSSIWMNPKLCINKSPFLWKDWLGKGIVKLGDIYHNGILKSFEDIVRQFGIPRSQFFRYLQLRHLLSGIFGDNTSAPKAPDLLNDVIKNYGRGHEASKYYSMLINNQDNGAISALKTIWEKDLNLSWEAEEWENIFKNIKLMSRDAKIRLMQFKIMHRFYWTPSRLYRLGLSQTPNCWRCKSEQGDLIHVLWSCDKVQEFWERICENICQVSGTQIPLSPRVFVLGEGSILPGGDKYIKNWVQTSLMIGRQILLRNWKTEGVPPFREWSAEMARVAAFEKMSYKRSGRMSVYAEKWGKYLTSLED